MGKLKGLVLAGLFSLAFQSHAKSEDLCSQLVGHWEGFYTIKDEKICELFFGCTHQIKATVVYPPTDLISTVFYEVLVSPSMGTGGVFEISCDHGVIYCTDYPPGTINVNCDEGNSCEMVYNDQLLLSKMTKN